MNFDDRLKRAIQRGEKDRTRRSEAAEAELMSTEELRTLHSGYRLELSEHIEECLKKLVDHLPGFEYQTILGDDGWGGRISRDDLHLVPGQQPKTHYSRMEMAITPFSSSAIVELTAKATVRNREIMNRKNYQKVDELDLDSFKDMIDMRVLEFAEQYSGTD